MSEPEYYWSSCEDAELWSAQCPLEAAEHLVEDRDCSEDGAVTLGEVVTLYRGQASRPRAGDYCGGLWAQIQDWMYEDQHEDFECELSKSQALELERRVASVVNAFFDEHDLYPRQGNIVSITPHRFRVLELSAEGYIARMERV